MGVRSKNISKLKESYLTKKTKPGKPIELIQDILVDADALIALIKTDDSNHNKAVSIAQNLQKIGCMWFVSPYTIGEVVTVISYKIGQDEAKRVLKELRRQSLNVLTLKEDDNLADKWFNQQSKKGTSYFDCYNMALLERYKKQLDAIFSFDSVYETNGFRLLRDSLKI